jgi:hypothetical protein
MMEWKKNNSAEWKKNNSAEWKTWQKNEILIFGEKHAMGNFENRTTIKQKKAK